jgi:hypothetical protein
MLTNLWAWIIRLFKRQSADTVLAGDRTLAEPEREAPKKGVPAKPRRPQNVHFGSALARDAYERRKRARKAAREARRHKST